MLRRALDSGPPFLEPKIGPIFGAEKIHDNCVCIAVVACKTTLANTQHVNHMKVHVFK